MTASGWLLIVVTAACTSAGSGADGDLRQDVLTALSNDVMVPSYRRVADNAASLVEQIEAACAQSSAQSPAQSPAQSRDLAREAWSATKGVWLSTRAFRFGPATTLRTMSTIDFPIDPIKIDALLASDEAITRQSLAELGSDQRGLGGIEHVLFGEQPLDARSCSYVTAATGIVAEASAEVLTAWTTAIDGEQPFAEQLTDPGQGGMYATEHDAYEDLINSMIFAIADVADARIGRASGDVTGTPVPADVDPGRARRARQDAIDVVTGVQALFDGAPSGQGIAAVVASISESTRDTMAAQLDEAIAALNALPSPLADATDPAPAHAAYEALKRAQVTLRAEIASQLGVTLTFGDADGDS